MKRAAIITAAVLAIGMTVLIISADWIVRTVVTNTIESRTGLSASIQGDVDADLLSLNPSIALKGLVMGGRDVSGMSARIDDLTVGLDARASLSGPLTFSQVRVRGVQLWVTEDWVERMTTQSDTPEASADPLTAWQQRLSGLPVVESLAIADADLHYVDEEAGFLQRVNVALLWGALPADGYAAIEGRGQIDLERDDADAASGAYRAKVRWQAQPVLAGSVDLTVNAAPVAAPLVGHYLPALINDAGIDAPFMASVRTGLRLQPDETAQAASDTALTTWLEALRLDPGKLTVSRASESLVSATLSTLPGERIRVGIDAQLKRFDVAATVESAALHRLPGNDAWPFQATVRIAGEPANPLVASVQGIVAAGAHDAATVQAINVDALRVTLADQQLDGSAAWQRNGPDDDDLTVSLHSQRVDVEPLLAFANQLGGPAQAEGDAGARMPAAPGFDPSRFALPSLDVTAELAVDAFAYRDETLRDVTLALTLDDQLAELVFESRADGEGSLAVAGSLSTRQDARRIAVRTEFTNLSLASLMRVAGLRDPVPGQVGGDLGLSASFESDSTGKPLPAWRDWAGWLERLELSPGSVRYEERAAGTDVRLDVRAAQNAQQAIRAGNTVQLRGDGRYRDAPFGLQATLGPAATLVQREPFALDVALEALNSELAVNGTISKPLALEDFDLSFQASGPDPSVLSPLFGIPLPVLPPYRLTGSVARDGEAFVLRRFDASVGNSDAQGDIRFIPGERQPLLYANVISRTLDLSDLASFIGAAPDTDMPPSAAQARLAAQRAQSPYLIPRTDLKLAGIPDAFTGKVTYRAQQVLAEGLPLTGFELVMDVGRNTLGFDPIRFALGDGSVEFSLVFDELVPTPKGKLEVQASQLPLGDLLPEREIADASGGLIGGRASLWVNGVSIGDMLGSADGGAYLIMTGGRLDALLLEAAGLDPLEALLSAAFDNGESAAIHCAWLDTLARNGVFDVSSALVDTADTLVVADGSLAARTEALDLVVQPRPKDFSLLSAPIPWAVTGTLKDPGFRPDASAAGTVAAVGVLAAAAGPLAAALPLVTPGVTDGAATCATIDKTIEPLRERLDP